MAVGTLRQIELVFPVKGNQNFAHGGLAQKAQEVRQGVGASGDTVLLHVNPEEYEFMKKHFGPERINPHTGLPQFGFFSDFLAPVAAVVASAFLGPAVGAAASSALGLGLGAAGEAALGAGLIGAGTGAVAGGAKGAVLGGLTGAIGSYALGPSGLNLVGGENSVLGGLTDKLGITGSGGLTESLGLDKLLPGTTTADTTATSTEAVSPSYPKGEAESLNELSKKFGSSSLSDSGLLSGGSLMKYALPAAVLAGALGGKKSTPTATATNSDANYGTHLSNVPFNRQAQAVDVANIAYGRAPNMFFKDNVLPSTVTAAQGRYIKGAGTGISDSIPARLSNGEYVFDAQTVSMLGDGSSDAGAKKLDQMREEIRKQKGRLLAKGKFPPKAHSPLSYLKGA